MNEVNAPASRQRKSKRYLTCTDLAKEKRWDKALCCAECHGDENLMILDAVSQPNPLHGYQPVFLCCHSFELLNDWYPGRCYHSLPEHE